MSDAPETNRAAGGKSLSTVGLGLSDRLRQWIPDGDGYNSEYAITLGDAADEIDRAQQSEREGWRYARELEQERKRLQTIVDRLKAQIDLD